MEQPIKFAKQLSDYLKGNLSGEEEKQVRVELDNNDSLRQLAELLQDESYVSQEVKRMQRFDTEAALSRVLSSEPVRQTRRLRLWLAAASVAVLLVAGSIVWYRQYTAVEPPVVPAEVQQTMVRSAESGRQEAQVEPVITARMDKRRVEKTLKQEYHITNDDVVEQLLEAKRVTTKHDKEFWLTLPDGSLVHLNYNTRLIYPERFGRSDRNVVLDGEAYFMVAKDKSRSFVVHTPDGDVKVYGTEFNVNTNNNTSVVLVKGSVSVTPTSGKETMLMPGQQATVNVQSSMVNGQQATVNVENVDLEPYVAWNTGRFVFENSTLEQLMRVMAQWYAIGNITFENEQLRQIHFTGSLQRYGNIDRVIQAITSVCDVEISQHGRDITIRRK